MCGCESMYVRARVCVRVCVSARVCIIRVYFQNELCSICCAVGR